MSKKKTGYEELERFLTILLFAALGAFLFYLLFAGIGITVLKTIFATLCFIVAGGGIFFLYKTKELRRSRSLWLTCSFVSLMLLTLVSLVCRFPAP